MTFDDIKGNAGVIARLRKTPHKRRGVYLFCGPEGTGKFTAARCLAKAIQCEEGGCNECRFCRSIDMGAHPDVHVIDNGYSEEIKIEDVRRFQQEIFLRPYQSETAVFIINDAHTLNHVSANALLKTLEEPPDYALVVLVTDKPQMLLKTIVSRCRIEKFSALGRQEFIEALSRVQGFDAVSARYLAYFCEGRLGSALRMKGREIVAEKNRIIDSFLSGSVRSSESYKKEDLREQMSVLAAWFRDIYLMKLGVDDPVNIDRRAELESACGVFSLEGLESLFSSISSSFVYSEQNVNARLLAANLQACLAQATGQKAVAAPLLAQAKGRPA